MKRTLLLICTGLSLMASAQVTDLQTAFPNGNNPTIFPSLKTYTTCGYLQESNAFENGRVSNTQFPLICADDFTIPAGQCWNIEKVSANIFTNSPTDASAMNIYFYADAAGVPGALVGTYIAAPADWSTSLIGNNFGFNVHEFVVNLTTPVNLCGGGAGTTYWFSIQAVNSLATGDFYWELAETGSPYGDNGQNAASNAGPWSAAGTDNFVFEINPAVVTDLTLTECPGFSITVGTSTYNSTGTYSDVLASVAGCDSIVNLDLTILPAVTGTDTQVACDSLVWIDGTTYYANNTTATFNIVAGSSMGCDSLVTLDLTVNNSSTGTDTQVACDSLVWIDGITYYTTNNTAMFNIVGGAANSCDSLVTLDVTIVNLVLGTDTQVACNSFLWIDGNTYNASNNTATHNIVGGAANSCDSLVTLDLTIYNSAVGTAVINGCDSIVWIDGITYTADNNTATFNIVGGVGGVCDSLVTLDLTIVASPNNGITLNVATLSADESGAAYQWVDCGNGNAPIAGETNQTYTPSVTGNYAVEITLNGCTVTSACTVVDYTSINEHILSLVSIYPNPTTGYVQVNGLDEVEGLQYLEITAANGALIATYTELVNEINISHLAEGIYFLNIVHLGGVESIRLIKL